MQRRTVRPIDTKDVEIGSNNSIINLNERFVLIITISPIIYESQ